MPDLISEQTADQAFGLAMSAIKKVDRDGPRGATNVSTDEVQALVLIVVAQAHALSQLKKPANTETGGTP